MTTWHHLLERAQVPFEIWTDHRKLEALKEPQKLGAEQLCWVEFFSTFQFAWHNFPGQANFLADAFSCLLQHRSQWEEVLDTMFSEKQLGRAVTTRKQAVHAPHKLDLIASIGAVLSTETSPQDTILTKGEDGCLYRGTQLFAPVFLRAEILKTCHDNKLSRHFGSVKTLHLVQRQFWWPGFRKDLSQYISLCLVCLLAKNREGNSLDC